MKLLSEEVETAPYTVERAASNAAPAVSPGRPGQSWQAQVPPNLWLWGLREMRALV